MNKDASGLSILVVDDDADLRAMLEMTFSKNGYKVFSAAQGVEAIAIVRSRRIDAVVTDICMPEMGGKELLELIRRDFPKIPIVVFVTGFSEVSTEEALAKGASAVITKPFDRKSLVQLVLESISKAKAS